MKHFIRSLLMAGVFLSFSVSASPDAAGWIEVTGEARDLKSQALLYTEHHRILRNNGVPVEHTVVYRDATGQDFAHKNVDYARSVVSPAFELKDSRDGYVEGARFDGERYVLYRQEAPSAKREIESLKFSADLVTDAGFDGYVRAHMDELLAGNKLEFRLGLAGALRTVGFRARLLERTQFEQQDAVRVRVEPDSWLRFLVDPLELIYTTQPVQLKVFEGRSNIRTANGDSIDARIVFGQESAYRETQTAESGDTRSVTGTASR